MINKTITQLLDKAVERHGDETALYFPAEQARISYTELKRSADLVSKALLKSGLRKGSHIGIWSTNRANWVYLAFGAAQIGVIFVPMNVSYKGRELMDICNRADVVHLFIMDSFKGQPCWSTVECFLKNGSVDRERFPELEKIWSMDDENSSGVGRWADFMSGACEVSDAELQAAIDDVSPEDTYIIQYTSGTTAKPKGARLYQRGVLNTANCYAHLLHLTSEDVTCVPLPLFHCFGNVLTLLGGIISGSCTIYLPAFSASQMLPLLEAERCTCLMGVPTMYSALMAHQDFSATKLSIVKAGIGGAYCPPALADAITKNFATEHLVIGYGLSEAASLCTLSDIDAPAEHRLYSVGAPLPELEVSLYDEAAGVDASLPKGEVVVRGFGVMRDYYNDPEDTQAALDKDGWLHTGDMGRFDESGYLHITGRIKDIIIRGGENISPSEIEELLIELSEIRDCQCVGIHDDVMGEEIVAFVIPQNESEIDDDKLRQFVAEHLAKYKVPKYIFHVDSFPLNAAGKVLKSELRSMAKELLK